MKSAPKILSFTQIQNNESIQQQTKGKSQSILERGRMNKYPQRLYQQNLPYFTTNNNINNEDQQQQLLQQEEDKEQNYSYNNNNMIDKQNKFRKESSFDVDEKQHSLSISPLKNPLSNNRDNLNKKTKSMLYISSSRVDNNNNNNINQVNSNNGFRSNSNIASFTTYKPSNINNNQTKQIIQNKIHSSIHLQLPAYNKYDQSQSRLIYTTSNANQHHNNYNSNNNINNNNNMNNTPFKRKETKGSSYTFLQDEKNTMLMTQILLKKPKIIKKPQKLYYHNFKYPKIQSNTFLNPISSNSSQNQNNLQQTQYNLQQNSQLNDTKYNTSINFQFPSSFSNFPKNNKYTSNYITHFNSTSNFNDNDNYNYNYNDNDEDIQFSKDQLEQEEEENEEQSIERGLRNTNGVSAESWSVLDVNTGELLYGQNQHTIRQMASLTKMMTLYVSLQIIQTLDISPYRTYVEVSKNAASINGTSARLLEGDRLSLWDLMHGMMLPSGNDAATALAENLGVFLFYQSEEYQNKYRENSEQFTSGKYKVRNAQNYFIEEMNKQAKKLELNSTNFANATGLVNNFNRSTAADLAKLSYHLIYSPEDDLNNNSSNNSTSSKVKKIVENKYHFAQIYMRNDKKRNTIFENTNKLLSHGYSGLKTGITTAAGPCLSAWYKDSSMNLIIILLNSSSLEQRWADTQFLVHYYSNQQKQNIFPQSSLLP